MPIGIRVPDLPAATGTLDDDDEFLTLEDGSLRRATRAQAGPKASIVQVTDTANQFTGTNVETVLAEIQDNVDALVISGGGIAVASEAEALAGTDNTKAISPLRLVQALANYPASVAPVWAETSDDQAEVATPALIAIGDSITDNNRTTTPWTGASASRTASIRGDGYLSRAMIALRQPARWRDVGISGETAADGLARFAADVTADRPQVVLEAFGSNDMVTSRTAAATFADKLAMWQMAWAIGAHVVTTTAPPRNDYTDAEEQEAHKLNRLLRDYAAANPKRLTLVDWFPGLVDATTGNFDATLVDASGVHPNTLGALVVGETVFADALRPLFPHAADDLATSNVNDLGNLLTNPLLTGTIGALLPNYGLSGPVADGWTAVSSGTDATVTAVLSKVTHPGGFGDWQQVAISTIPAGGTVSVFRAARAEWAVGDIVEAVCEFETDAASWGNGALELQIMAVNGGTIHHLATAQGRGADTTLLGRQASGVLRTPPIVIPTGTATLRAHLICGGTGTVRWGRVVIRKLPT